MEIDDDPRKNRRYIRRPVQVSFRMHDAEDPSVGDILFDAVDLSQGGAFLQSDLLLEVGETMEVVFNLPGEIRAVTVIARVAWATRKSASKGVAGMGLQFVDMSPADREAISTFVRSAR